MKDIEPCPCCGHSPQLYKLNGQPVYMLQCVREWCNLKAYGVSKERVISRWNDLADEKARDIGKHRERGWEKI